MGLFKKDILGIDLGYRTLKGVQLKQDKKGRVSLQNHFFHDLALTSENFPECNRDEVFKAALETHGLQHAYSATAVKDSEVMSFTFSLPVMSDQELAQVVPQEIAEQAHIAIDDHSCDYLLTKDPSNPEATTVKAYCVKRDLIVEQLKQLKDAGLKPQSVESEMLAIRSMLNFNGYIDLAEVCVIFDLGERHMVSGLIADGMLALTKTDETSFGSVNRILQNQFNLTYEEADRIKKDFDFMIGPETPASDLMEAVETAFAEVFKSIKQALEFYKECPESSSRIDKVFLIGGGSQIKSVVQIIEQFLKVPTQIVNPFRNIDIFTGFDEQSSKDIALLAPFMGTAVGLALSSVAEEKAA